METLVLFGKHKEGGDAYWRGQVTELQIINT